jgi:DNA topoisomerase-3
MPEHYRPELKKWTLESLPILPGEYKYLRSEATADQAKIVSTLIQTHKNDDIVIATDAGREGELIARIALREAGLTDLSGCRRFWVSEALTEDVIRKGLTGAKPLSDYDLIAVQGYARQHADWLVGINLTRYLSIGNREVFSVGRVQSAVLAAVAVRNYKVNHFIPTPYQELEITLEDATGTVIKAALVNTATGKTSFTPKDPYVLAARHYAARRNRELTITSATVTKRQKPDKLLNLTALQKQAYKLYGYSPDETLAAAQTLYEKYKCLSYPRTPSRVMGDNNADLFRSKYQELASRFSRWSQYSRPELITGSNKHIFNSEALEDHHALIPLALLPEEAPAREKNVYLIVVRSFFTVCMDDHVWNECRYRIKNGEYLYRASTREILEEGWKKSIGKDEAEEDDKTVRTVKPFNADNCSIRNMEILDKQSSPPKDFQIDTLLAFMETPQAEEKQKEGRLAGLGTPATRAEIIKTLFDRGYVREEKKRLTATKKGLWLLARLKSNADLMKIADVSRTTEWEQQLETDPAAFEQSITAYVKSCIKPRGPGEAAWEQEAAGICPLCGNKVYEGKKSYYCSAWKGEKPCAFVVWKEVAGATISSADIKLLLEKKKTPVKTCTSKKGEKFKAAFRLDDTGGIVFRFPGGKGKKSKPGA